MTMADSPPLPPQIQRLFDLPDDEFAQTMERLFGFRLAGNEVRKPLATADEAREYAVGVFVATQRRTVDPPFTVVDAGDSWVVRSGPTNWPFPLLVELRKDDASVVRYASTDRDGRVMVAPSQ